jgi:hypothetical protein
MENSRRRFNLSTAIRMNELQGLRYTTVPVKNLKVKKRDVVLVDLVLMSYIGDRFPYFRADDRV